MNWKAESVSDAIGLISFYIALAAFFVGGLFSSRISTWYGEVRSFRGNLDALEEDRNQGGTPDRTTYLRLERKRNELSKSKPFTTFIFSGGLLFVITIFAWFVPIENRAVNRAPLFIFAPIAVITIAYWVVGCALLTKGELVLKTAEQPIKAGTGIETGTGS